MKEFKEKYFYDNVYWVNRSNHKLLQKIALEVGCLCHTGKKEIIKWHEGFNILGFRTYPENGNITLFQKEPFVMATEAVTDFAEMFIDYKKFLTTKQNHNEQIEI